MTVLVTGGTGFIGSHVVETLLARGEEVRCLVRDPDRPRWLAGLDIERVRGDCSRAGSLGTALRGVDRVIHLAGTTFAATEAAFFRHNTEGTANLLAASLAAGVEQFILVSSQAAAGSGTRRNPAREEDPARPLTPYGRSKLAAETICREHADRIAIRILRPSAVYGPRDTAFLPYFRLVKRGFLLELGSGKREVSLCFVNDLAEAIVSASNSQLASGSVYFVADSEPYVWDTVERLLCAYWGVSGFRIVVPGVVLKMAGVVGQAYGGLTGRSVPINRARAVELLEKQWVCDSTAARRDLGFPPGKNLQNGLHKAVLWYEQNNWL